MKGLRTLSPAGGQRVRWKTRWRRGVETRAALVDTWKRSEGKEGKIKSEANYIHNGRKTGETSRM